MVSCKTEEEMDSKVVYTWPLITIVSSLQDFSAKSFIGDFIMLFVGHPGLGLTVYLNFLPHWHL